MTTATLKILPEGVGNEGIIDEIVCTLNYPFYVLNADSSRRVIRFEGDENKGDMQPSDKCLLASGKTAVLREHSIQHLDKPIATCNFEVVESHTYHVGMNGICLHNNCPKYWGYNNGQSQKAYATNRHVDKIDDLVQSTAGPPVNTNPSHATMNVFDCQFFHAGSYQRCQRK